MSKLEELINELCPNGVEYKPLWSITSWDKRFNGVEKEKQKEIIKFKHVSAEKLKSLNIEDGDITLVSTGKFTGYTTKTLAEEYINNGECITIPSGGGANIKYISGYFVDGGNILGSSYDKTKYNLKFIYYYLLKNVEIIESYYRGGSVKHPEMSKILNLEIPVPPLPIQEEIVRILDNFTKLTAKLTAELEARKKQYEYYRDKMLSFSDEVTSSTLGDICNVTKLAGFEFTNYVKYSNDGRIIALRGLNVKNGHLDLSDVKYIDSSDFSKLNRSKLKIGDMLFTYVGTVGQVALVDENDRYYLAPNVALIRIRDDNVLNCSFLKYYFQSKHLYINQIEKLQQNSSMKNLTMEKIRKFIVPVPSLEEQQRIVNILDKFDEYCNDITKGLPAEIEMRKKQYEYYRDKLLTFKRLEA